MFGWLESLASMAVVAMGLDPAAGLGSAVSFFLYDTVKILILLFVVTFAMTSVAAVFPVERVRTFLSSRKLYGLQYLFAAVFGAITPFCSCSSVPLFIGFVRGGIPLGVTLSFLITSPLVNEIAIAIFLGMFGLYTTVVYVVTGVLLGVVGGIVLSTFRLERLLTPWAQEAMQTGTKASAAAQESFKLQRVATEALSIVRSVVPYVLIGIGIGAAMHGFVPAAFFEDAMKGSAIWSVPVAVLAGVPLYSNAAGVLPIIHVLVSKGVPLGTAISFMMAVVGLSIPEGALLKKVMTTRLIALYFGVITMFIILSGYLFNAIL